MFKLTKLIQFQTGVSPADRTRAMDALTGIDAPLLLQPTLPGVYNGGDLIWHLQFPTEADYRRYAASERWRHTIDALLGDTKIIANVESAAYAPGRSGDRGAALKAGVYRTLFLSIPRTVAPATVARFETELFAMPDYIASMNRWQLSRVTEAGGTRPWTHVWEQEYADLAGLTGPYMTHPYHWGYMDRWFDPECTDWIVDTFLCHTFCAFTGGVIGPTKQG